MQRNCAAAPPASVGSSLGCASCWGPTQPWSVFWHRASSRFHSPVELLTPTDSSGTPDDYVGHCDGAALPWLMAAQSFIELPTWVGKELLAYGRWPVSLSDPIGKFETIALLLVTTVTLLFLSCRRAVPSYCFGIVMGTVAFWSLLITLNPFLVHDVRESGVVGRLGHLAYIQIAILVPGLAWSILQIYRKASSVVLAAVLVLLAASVRSALPTGLEPNFLLDREQILKDFASATPGDNSVFVAMAMTHGHMVLALSQQRFPQDLKGNWFTGFFYRVRRCHNPFNDCRDAKGMIPV